MTLEGITLHTEPAYPTRTGNSVSRDTCPDLTMGINLPQPRWWNSQENLGSDHFIIHTSLSYDRRVTIRIGDLKSQPITMGDFGTPQGAVPSPLLFNIALMRLPEALNRISEVRHAIYADDVTIWSRSGNLGQIEEAFQQAASVVEQIGRKCVRLRTKQSDE
ncbi:hypothetical protein HPB52_002445 [Rhipicephalus sanguineus]|uniref:Reverse transcriptase domain-containing protein n=1 Tax=Rhipicephalus sanguineus TaxID=34632 RepID=A0A9D4SM51_RHISA|nr:hypothetical protein HPB52_002445 [Rhipicephalus sanguineus]